MLKHSIYICTALYNNQTHIHLIKINKSDIIIFRINHKSISLLLGFFKYKYFVFGISTDL